MGHVHVFILSAPFPNWLEWERGELLRARDASSLVPRPFPRLHSKIMKLTLTRGVASNEAGEAVASSLFRARTRARIGDTI